MYIKGMRKMDKNKYRRQIAVLNQTITAQNKQIENLNVIVNSIRASYKELADAHRALLDKEKGEANDSQR